MDIEDLYGKLQADAGERVIGFKHHHAFSDIRHAPRAPVGGFSRHFINDCSGFKNLRMRKILCGNQLDRFLVVFAEGILGFEMDRKAFTGEAPFKSRLELRENIAVTVEIDNPLRGRFFDSDPERVRTRV